MTTSNRGGKRPGAGRKVGSGQYKEATVTKRIPLSLLPLLDNLLFELKNRIELPENVLQTSTQMSSVQIPIAESSVRAGFLATADAGISHCIDFNKYLLNDEQNVIGIYAEGNSMCDAGIDDGDLLIVKYNQTPKNKDIVIASLNQEFTVKRLLKIGDRIELHPENLLEDYPIIIPQVEDEMNIVGVVSFVIKKL